MSDKNVKKEDQKFKDTAIYKWWSSSENRGNKMFQTISAFALGVAINVLAKGFTDGFDVTDIWSWSSLIVGFASGLGIPAVQDDAIRKAIITFLVKNKLYDRYRKENIVLSDKITNKTFRRFFIKNTNENDLKDLREREFDLQTDDLQSRIANLQSKKIIAKYPEKVQKQIDQLESKLKEINENGVDVIKLGWEPIEINDVFNFDDNKGRIGKKSLRDNSLEKHRKKNWIARFYMPVIMMVLQGSALGIIKDSIDSVILSSIVFILILIYTWFNTNQSHLSLKEEITLPVEKNRNDLLKDADREYDEWKAINEIVIDFSGPLDQNSKEDLKIDLKKDLKKKPLEIIIKGTFGSVKSTTKGDLPSPFSKEHNEKFEYKQVIPEGTSYICIINSYYSNLVKKRFVINDQVILYEAKWIHIDEYNKKVAKEMK